MTSGSSHLEPIHASAKFVAHACKPVCEQALEILRGLGRNAQLLTSPDPYIDRGSVLLLPLPVEQMPNRFIRRLPLDGRRSSYRSGDEPLVEVIRSMGLHDRISEALIINERRLGPDGRIESSHLNRFTDALKVVCGYRPPRDPSRPARNWRAERDQRRAERRHEMYGGSLWPAFG